MNEKMDLSSALKETTKTIVPYRWIKHIKKMVKIVTPESIKEWVRYRKQVRFVKKYQIRRQMQISKYLKEGKNIYPPHGIKEDYVEKYANEFSANILIETGTYLGEMVYAMKDKFDHIISIELNKRLYKNALKFFRKEKHVKIVNGDSGKMLPKILENINSKCLFWLDAHYSGGITAKGELSTPIEKELISIEQHSRENHIDHVILIDDAREFDGTDDYPEINQFEKFIKALFPGYNFKVQDDIIIIHK